jgi:hypothetical protein
MAIAEGRREKKIMYRTTQRNNIAEVIEQKEVMYINREI